MMDPRQLLPDLAFDDLPEGARDELDDWLDADVALNELAQAMRTTQDRAAEVIATTPPDPVPAPSLPPQPERQMVPLDDSPAATVGPALVVALAAGALSLVLAAVLLWMLTP